MRAFGKPYSNSVFALWFSSVRCSVSVRWQRTERLKVEVSITWYRGPWDRNLVARSECCSSSPMWLAMDNPWPLWSKLWSNYSDLEVNNFIVKKNDRKVFLFIPRSIQCLPWVALVAILVRNLHQYAQFNHMSLGFLVIHYGYLWHLCPCHFRLRHRTGVVLPSWSAPRADSHSQHLCLS